MCGNVVIDCKIVDHRYPLKVSNDQRLSQDNLWTLCCQCYNIETNHDSKIADKDNATVILKHVKRELWQKIISERFK